MSISNMKSSTTASSSSSATVVRAPSIGGPGTLLPPFVESFLSWSLAISCLSVSGYHYLVATFVTPMWTRLRHSTVWNLLMMMMGRGDTTSLMMDKKDTKPVLVFPCWLPLMTCSRSELARATPMERYQQLVQVLESTAAAIAASSKNEAKDATQWSDDDLVVQLRSNEICRRLASLAMRPVTTSEHKQQQQSPHTLRLGQQLIRIWPRLLELPNATNESLSSNNAFDISIIMPAYRERGVDVQTKLNYALEGALHPEKIQVVLIDAGHCQDLAKATVGGGGGGGGGKSSNNNNTSTTTNNKQQWGEVKMVTFHDGGGRGPALNFGARHATGRVLTFCHSDTRLPPAWDVKVTQTLSTTTNNHNNHNHHSASSFIANSCAFAFGIDTTVAGLNGGPYPPGIKAVETTANIRTHLYSLPYGDQCLSIPTNIFHYLGGFPDQCLLEDYELIGLLRKRAALLPKFFSNHHNNNVNNNTNNTVPQRQRERLCIIGGPPALCSPRRWQNFGVLYVTFTNSKCVNLYAGGGNPNDIFQLYYGGPPPERSSELSPWEVELQHVLSSKQR